MATCQHKDGCDKEATDRVVATYNGRQHVRLLCPEHMLAAMFHSGLEHVRAVVEGRYGRFRKASVRTKSRTSLSLGHYSTTTRMLDSLGMAVAENSTLQPGDVVQAVLTGYHMRRGEWYSIRWGVTTVESVGAPVRAKSAGASHRYRLAKIPWPFAWREEVASIVQYPLHPAEYMLKNGEDEKKRWKAHFDARRTEETAKQLAAYDAERAKER